MAYDSSKETNTELISIDKNTKGDKLRVSQITLQGGTTKYVDIRNMYTPAGYEEVRPTSKGVRFNSELALDIMKSMLTVLEADELECLYEEIGSMLKDTEE